MVSKFALAYSISPFLWTGYLYGRELHLELLPWKDPSLVNGERFGDPIAYEPDTQLSSMALRIPDLHLETILKPSGFQSEEKEVLAWGPAKIRSSLIGIGKPSDLPANTLLIATIKDASESNWDPEDFMAFLLEATSDDLVACANAGIQDFETGDMAPNDEAWKAAIARAQGFENFYRAQSARFLKQSSKTESREAMKI